jgi:hypothetical protein
VILVCLEATNVALNNVNEGPKLIAKHDTLLGAYTVLEVVVENLLKPRGWEFGRPLDFEASMALQTRTSISMACGQKAWKELRSSRNRLGEI